MSKIKSYALKNQLGHPTKYPRWGVFLAQLSLNAIKNQRGASKIPGALDATSWFFMALESWWSITMNLSTNESVDIPRPMRVDQAAR